MSSVSSSLGENTRGNNDARSTSNTPITDGKTMAVALLSSTTIERRGTTPGPPCTQDPLPAQLDDRRASSPLVGLSIPVSMNKTDSEKLVARHDLEAEEEEDAQDD